MSRPPLEIAKTAQELFAPFEIFQREAFKAGELVEKLENQNITISVIGQFKRGKSTLVNSVLEDELLPVGIVPVTAAVTEIVYGAKAADVHFSNGVVKPVSFDELAHYINEQENPENRLEVSAVTMSAPSEFLKCGITLVDTPGVGSVHKNNTDAAYAFVKESDAVIFMLSVDSPINQIEIDFLKNASEYASKFYFAVNKIDVISREDLQVYLAYCNDLLCRIMKADKIAMFPVSSKTGEGIEALKSSIIYDCNNSLLHILEESVKKKLADMIDSSMKQIKLYRNAMSMPIEDLDSNFKEIEKLTEAFRQERNKISDSIVEKISGMEKEMRDELLQFESIDMTISGGMMTQIYKKYLISLKTWEFIMSNQIEAKINEMKNQITATVSTLFGIDYHYDIEELDFMKKGFNPEDDEKQTEEKSFEKVFLQYTGEFEDKSKSKGKYLSDKMEKETEALCRELTDTLNAVFMYREENAYVVVRRIEDLNKLVRHLRSLRVKI